MKKLIIALAALLFATPALATTCPTFTYGLVLTAAQWQACFDAKQNLLGYTPFPSTGGQLLGPLKLVSGTTAGAPLNIPQGIVASSPVNGDIWTTSSGVYARINGTTMGPFAAQIISSVFGRTGAVTAQSGDYSFAQLSATPTTVAGYGITDLIAYTNANQTFTKAQRVQVTMLSLSGSSATPNFDNGQNFSLTLVHASCPCTMANPSTTPVAGQSGVIEVDQSSTGSDTLAWGSKYYASGGTAAIVLSTAANAKDFISYYVADSTHIIITTGALNVTH